MAINDKKRLSKIIYHRKKERKKENSRSQSRAFGVCIFFKQSFWKTPPFSLPFPSSKNSKIIYNPRILRAQNKVRSIIISYYIYENED